MIGFSLPNSQAATAPEMVIVVVLQIISAKAPAVVKLLVVPSKPKSTEKRKSMAKINPDFNPDENVLAPDHLITVVTRQPTANVQRTIAHTIS